MAESVFQVNDINVSLTDKKITVEFSKDKIQFHFSIMTTICLKS